ncbi:MAG: DUF983 domain-containing protein [Gemmatimonadales bacterium]
MDHSTPEVPPPPAPAIWPAFRRALRLRCPACGGGPVFLRWFRIAPSCASCGLRFSRGEPGYWLGAYFINLVAAETVFAVLLGVALWWTWPDPPWGALVWGLAAAMVLAPIASYPLSHTLFLAFDLLCRPPTAEDYAAPHEPARTARRHH